MIPEPNNGRRLKYDKNIDRPDIRPGIERILNNIKLLLDEGARINKKYGETPGTQHSTSQGMQVFKTSFDRFKSRIRKHQRDASAWKVTSWAVHDAKNFESLIERLRRYVDGLESITKSLGLLEHQHSRLKEEIDSISDVESLRLLRDASSSHGNSPTRAVSDTASNRMIVINEEEHITLNATTRTSNYDSSLSFKTALTRKSTETGNITGKECSFLKKPANEIVTMSTSVSHAVSSMYDTTANASLANESSQNRRLMQGFIGSNGWRRPLNFSGGDKLYGKVLATIKKEDTDYWVRKSQDLVATAEAGNAVLKRIFLELRDIRQAQVPFISAVPINDRLDTILASIEGPPDTPYEGGVFWITMRITDHYPNQLPLMRFNTKIYHPNISPQGRVCYADGQLRTCTKLLKVSDGWFNGTERRRDWSIGALLTALCGLLSSPDVDDPLVPEIAQTYLIDYYKYCYNARIYTEKYATNKRPDEPDLVFLDNPSKETNCSDSFDYHQIAEKLEDKRPSLPNPSKDFDKHQSFDDSISLQSSLRNIYDDAYSSPRSTTPWPDPDDNT